MGGGLIADILAAGVDKLASVERLILQPNNREDELRSWLMANHFKIIAEKIITENDKFYEIMVVEHELKKLEFALPHVPKNLIDDRATISQKIAAIKEAINESK